MANLSAHKTPKRFSMEGVLRDDADIIRLRTQYENMLLHQMRDEGYVPVLDLGPLWSTEFRTDGEYYYFVLSMFGIFVGKKKVKLYEGYSGNGVLYKRS